MGSLEIVLRLAEDDPRSSDIMKIIQAAPQSSPRGKTESGSRGRSESQVPPYIKLLALYEERGGRVSIGEAWVVNAKAYSADARGAGGMYTKAAGYFDWDESTQSYVLTEKARKVLEEYRQKEAESMRDTDYATELSRATFGDTGKEYARIERLRVKATGQEEIRFSWWKGDRMMPRPLDLPEEDLLSLFQNAIQAGVFTPKFLVELKKMLEPVR